MEYSKSSELISQQMHRVQEWFGARDVKHWFRRLWSETSSEKSPTPSESRPSSLSGFEWEEPRTLRSATGPTRADLERLKDGRLSSHSIVFLDDSDLEELFEPTVREESRLDA